MRFKIVTIAHWVANLAYPLTSVAEWCALVRTVAKDAADAKADILLIPEYISEHWLHFAPADLPPTAEVAWMAEQSEKVFTVLQDIAKEHDLAFVAGTMPWPSPKNAGAYRNRSWVFFPDRPPIHHDKLVMTPFEKDESGWMLETGDELTVASWRDINLAVLVCLDIEMPALSSALAETDVDLVLVPSMTEKSSGYHRVFNCARARAVELMAPVAVVGSIGNATKGGVIRAGNTSGASLYLPCEEALGSDGIHSETPMHDRAEGRGALLISKDVPVGLIRDTRKNKPEVWPGVWRADKIKTIKG